MGNSNWSDAAYQARQHHRSATNQTAFTYDSHVRASGVTRVHDQMNPHGVTRESRVRFLKPLYKGEPMRIEGTVSKESGDLYTVAVRLIDKKLQLCVEADVEIFALSAEQVRRMTPDGMVPPELKRYLP